MQKKKQLYDNATYKSIKHTQKRARQRARMNLPAEDVLALGRKIRKGESEFVKALSNTRTVHLVEYKGKKLAVQYHKNKKMVVTAYYAKKDNNNGHNKAGLQSGEV